MKIFRIVFSIIVVAGLFTGLSASAFTAEMLPGERMGALTLKECYALALERSESIGIQKELLKETEGQVLQALSGALPKVAFAHSQKWQDIKPNDTFGGYQPESKFTLTQPLFTGFKEFAAIGASRHLGKQRAEEQKRAEQLLQIDVSDAFYLYMSYQEDLAVQEEVYQILKDRVEELKRRQLLGKSRPSEVGSARAKLFQTESNMETTRGQKEVAAQLLEFLIGRPFEQLSAGAIPQDRMDIRDLDKSADSRPDVQAAREALAVLKKNITIARSAYFPSVTLTGNSYTKRSDVNESNDWDATINVNVPIFNGMSDAGQVAQARAQANEAELKLSETRRKAWLEIRNAAANYESTRRKFAALAKAVDATEKNYDLQREDFEKSLVNNLDVLQALEDLQSVRLQQATVKSDLNRQYWAFKVAIGETLQ